MDKKKILFVINSLTCGGAEKSMVSLLSLVDYSRYEVELQMFSPNGMFLKLLPEQVQILPELAYLRFCREGGGPFRWYWTRLRTAIGLRRRPKYCGHSLRDAQIYWKYAGSAYPPLPTAYDVAIAWGQGNPTHFVAEKVCAKRKLALINSDYEAAGYNKWFDLPFYRAFDRIVLVSDGLRTIMEDVFPELRNRMRTLYDIRNQSLTERMACEFDPYSEQNVPILATVGRMAPQKGYDLAVEAGAVLKAHGTAFRWYLVGDGPERLRIEQMICEKGLCDCMFTVGATENPYPYMKYADVYVQTSRTEGYCLTLSEARGLHTPPVSTNFDVVYEQLRHGENGLIVDMTPEAIAEGIETMLMDDALRESIRQTLSAERVGNEEEIENFYKLLADES